jgi:hypothetical protein
MSTDREDTFTRHRKKTIAVVVLSPTLIATTELLLRKLMGLGNPIR